MVTYTKYMGALRLKYVPQKSIKVQLPPVKEDCTCVVEYALSMYNSPVEYCSVCNNTGYIETAVEFDLTGSVVDLASDNNTFANALEISEGGDFNYQRYVIHANLKDCEVYDYDYQNCFDLSKELKIDNADYKILTIDKSTMLGQIRAVISRTN
jgi:hypothetical protein